MFAAVYQFAVLPGREEEYQAAWHQLVTYFIEHLGALGSTLHRCEDGTWVAYSRWPSRAARDAAWPGGNHPREINELVNIIKSCGDPSRKFPELGLEIVDDLLFQFNKCNM